MQPIFLNRLTFTTGSNLPKIINVQTLESFPLIQESEKIKVWFVIAELLNKALPDEQRNEGVFELVRSYLDFLNTNDIEDKVLILSLLKFKIKFMELIGLQIHAPQADSDQVGILFSATKGGFYTGQQSSDARSVSAATWQTFLDLQTKNFSELHTLSADPTQLQDLVNQFISWQLERDIKADKFLN